MPFFNITNVLKFDYWIEADNAGEAIKEAIESDEYETEESWHSVEINTEDEEDEGEAEPEEGEEGDEDEDLDEAA
jgi:hypothetical protein